MCIIVYKIGINLNKVYLNTFYVEFECKPDKLKQICTHRQIVLGCIILRSRISSECGRSVRWGRCSVGWGRKSLRRRCSENGRGQGRSTVCLWWSSVTESGLTASRTLGAETGCRTGSMTRSSVLAGRGWRGSVDIWRGRGGSIGVWWCGRNAVRAWESRWGSVCAWESRWGSVGAWNTCRWSGERVLLCCGVRWQIVAHRRFWSAVNCCYCKCDQ
jgi:hypothetical protein